MPFYPQLTLETDFLSSYQTLGIIYNSISFTRPLTSLLFKNETLKGAQCYSTISDGPIFRFGLSSGLPVEKSEYECEPNCHIE